MARGREGWSPSLRTVSPFAFFHPKGKLGGANGFWLIAAKQKIFYQIHLHHRINKNIEKHISLYFPFGKLKEMTIEEYNNTEHPTVINRNLQFG